VSEIYRDRTEGAAAKRQELLRRRRDELVTMPHAVRRVVVARSARIAAGMAIALSGAVLLVAAATPKLALWMTTWLPGIQPAPLSTLLSVMWIVGIVAWAIGRARVEHRFAVAMSHYVLPGDDLDQDIERLDHERPDEIAREMAHGLEVSSAAWPVIAAALILPVTALYISRGVAVHGWPVMSEFEASLAAHSGALIAIAIGGAVAAIVMTRRSARMPAAAPIAGSAALLAALVAIGLAARGAHAVWWVAGLAVITGSIGYAARRLRIERVLIAADDPAAGSELFTLRGFLRSVRTQLGTAYRMLRGVRGYRLWRFALLAFVIAPMYLVFGRGHSSSARVAAIKPGAVMPRTATAVEPSPSLAPDDKVVRVGNRFEVDVTLGDHAVDIESLSDLGMVPANWHATIGIELGSTDAKLAVSPFPGATDGMMNLGGGVEHVEFQVDNCDGRVQPLGLHLERALHETGTQRVTLYITPKLEVAHCQ
jgi:hypothetical protein